MFGDDPFGAVDDNEEEGNDVKEVGGRRRGGDVDARVALGLRN